MQLRIIQSAKYVVITALVTDRFNLLIFKGIWTIELPWHSRPVFGRTLIDGEALCSRNINRLVLGMSRSD